MDQAMRRAAGALALDPRDGPRLSEVPTRYGEQPRVTWPDYSGAAAYLSALRAEVKRTQERRATGRGPDASPG
jgi:hypothetical protein